MSAKYSKPGTSRYFLGSGSAVKLVDREILKKEREIKLKVEQEKAAEKERKKAEQTAKDAAKEAQKRIPPSDMFKSETDKYSKFDNKVSALTKNRQGVKKCVA